MPYFECPKDNIIVFNYMNFLRDRNIFVLTHKRMALMLFCFFSGILNNAPNIVSD